MDNKRNKQRITALILMLTLLLGGCRENNKKQNDHFELVENENNEIVAMDDSYIDNEYIDNYFVVEVYNKMREENQVYIAYRELWKVRSNWNYVFYDVFSNLKIIATNDMDREELMFSYVKMTTLREHIISLGLGQLKYSYDDMKNIYEVIKENYVYENDNVLTRKREIN